MFWRKKKEQEAHVSSSSLVSSFLNFGCLIISIKVQINPGIIIMNPINTPKILFGWSSGFSEYITIHRTPKHISDITIVVHNNSPNNLNL